MKIEYINVQSFFLSDFRQHMPPHERFYDLLNEKEKGDDALIWLECLFFRHGMISKASMAQTQYFIWEESDYYFTCNGVSCRWGYDDKLKMFESFAVERDRADQRNAVAETIRGLIESEGSSVTYDEWDRLKQILYPAEPETTDTGKRTSRSAKRRGGNHTRSDQKRGTGCHIR